MNWIMSSGNPLPNELSHEPWDNWIHFLIYCTQNTYKPEYIVSHIVLLLFFHIFLHAFNFDRILSFFFLLFLFIYNVLLLCVIPFLLSRLTQLLLWTSGSFLFFYFFCFIFLLFFQLSLSYYFFLSNLFFTRCNYYNHLFILAFWGVLIKIQSILEIC